MPQPFKVLADSRRKWISEVLIPWCRQASLAELREAEFDWINIAGRVDPAATLWTWAWSRFPCLVHEKFPGVNETLKIRVTLTDGQSFSGYPDSRESTRGQLVLTHVSADGATDQLGPFSIDEVTTAELSDPVNESLLQDLPDRPVTTLPPETPTDQRV